jgi:nitronate monooxygenase
MSAKNKFRADFPGVELPIVQAPMAGVQGSALAIAVSKAGGVGSLPCAMLTPGQMRSELERIRAATDRPCNINFFCHAIPEPDAAVDARWRQVLAPYYREFGVEAPVVVAGGSRLPFNEAAAALIEEFRPSIVSFHFGLPAPALVARVKATGAQVWSSATTVAEALWLERNGADAVIAQGVEAGGHRGMFLSEDVSTQLGTLALVPQIVAAVKVPVIAAGGIADAAGVSAVRALGAAAAQVGTAYLLCPEATTAPLHRAALQSGAVHSTALTNVLTGRPARGIVNRLMREVGPMHDSAPRFPLAAAYLAELRAAAEKAGRDDFSTMWCGQNASGCSDISAGELTRRLAGRA